MSGPGSRFKGKHSLDSDEEDEGEDTTSSKYDILASDDVEGMCSILFKLYSFQIFPGMTTYLQFSKSKSTAGLEYQEVCYQKLC